MASMGPPIYIGGNSGALIKRFYDLAASMGPPIYIGGNAEGLVVSWERLRSFNGATDLYRWKRTDVTSDES